jgi:hypothetical protein
VLITPRVRASVARNVPEPVEERRK